MERDERGKEIEARINLLCPSDRPSSIKGVFDLGQVVTKKKLQCTSPCTGLPCMVVTGVPASIVVISSNADISGVLDNQETNAGRFRAFQSRASSIPL